MNKYFGEEKPSQKWLGFFVRHATHIAVCRTEQNSRLSPSIFKSSQSNRTGRGPCDQEEPCGVAFLWQASNDLAGDAGGCGVPYEPRR